jgi:hypothetical protein
VTSPESKTRDLYRCKGVLCGHIRVSAVVLQGRDNAATLETRGVVVQFINRGRLNWIDVLAVSGVIVLGLIRLPQPFMGDQALNTVMASKITRGGIIYRDLWDLKQPGIFGFLLVGGRLFGFSEIGIHTFELIYMVAFSVVLICALKDRFEHRTVAGLVPLFTVGIYYCVSEVWHQTQTEALVGFPIFVSLWYSSRSLRAEGNRGMQLFLSGLSGGVALLFKFLVLPILAAAWLIAFIGTVLRTRVKPLATVFRLGWPLMFGVSIPLVLTLGYFA